MAAAAALVTLLLTGFLPSGAAVLVAASLPGPTPADTLVRASCLALGAVMLARRTPLWAVLTVSLAVYLAARATVL